MKRQIEVLKTIHGEVYEMNLDVLMYGLEIGIISVAVWGTIIIIAITSNNVYETMLFFSAFMIVRKTTRGYHARTKWQCVLYSLSMYCSVIVLIKCFKVTAYMYALGIISAVMCLLVFNISQSVCSNASFLILKDKRLYIRITKISLLQNMIIITIVHNNLLYSGLFFWSLGMFFAIFFLFIGIKDREKVNSNTRNQNKNRALEIKAEKYKHIMNNMFIKIWMCILIFVEINSICAGPFYEPEIPDVLKKSKEVIRKD